LWGGPSPRTWRTWRLWSHAASIFPGKRAVEERIVAALIDSPEPESFREELLGYQQEIEGAKWRVLSARRADNLLREKLFERVFAVRVRGFTRNYRNAELDMHFSLKDDLTDLQDFLQMLKEHGLQGLSSRLERGAV
jgi:hypothetical protein